MKFVTCHNLVFYYKLDRVKSHFLSKIIHNNFFRDGNTGLKEEKLVNTNKQPILMLYRFDVIIILTD